MVLDLDEPKLELATKLGADLTINTSNLAKGEIVSLLKSRNSGRGADAVIDFVGNEVTATLGFNLLGKEGRLVLVGLFGGAAQFSLPYFPLKGAEVIGAYTGTIRDMVEMIDLTRRGVIVPVIAGKFKLGDANDVLEKLYRREIQGRAVLAP